MYLPCWVGVQTWLYNPLMSLFTVPRSWVLPFESMAVNFTGTPVASAGIVFCMCRYAIHAPMFWSEIAGVSLELGVWSVTVPWIIMLDPVAMAVWGAVTVVLLGPLPKV